MANVSCQSEDGNNAIFIGTLLANGESVALCQDCFVEFLAATLEGLTGAPIGAFMGEYLTQLEAAQPTGGGEQVSDEQPTEPEHPTDPRQNDAEQSDQPEKEQPVEAGEEDNPDAPGDSAPATA
jgi:hypothetical protein